MYVPDNSRKPIPIRVLHVGPDVSSRGGIASVLSGYAANLAIFESLGCALSLQSTYGASGMQGAWQFAAAWWRIVGGSLRGSFDIVHIHTSIRGSLLRKWLLAITCIGLRQTYVLHIHSGAMERYVTGLPWVSRVGVNLMLRRAARLFCLSQSMQSGLIRYGDFAPEKCQLVFNGISTPTLGKAKDKNGLSSETVILFLGKLTEAKGITVLLDAAEKLKKKDLQFRVLVGGNGDVEGLLAAIDCRRLTNEVRFLGWIDGDEKAQLLANADIFVLPSRSEGFPVSIVEAMAFGAAVVSTAIPGVTDAVTHKQEALLVPTDDANALADALFTLVTDPGLRNRLANAARQRFDECFTIQRTADTLSRAYHEVMQ